MPQRARDYLPGERLPGTVYAVVRLIGAGGMGTVYDVEDTTIGKRYVLKTLHPQLGAREDLARRMRDEARTLAKLNHPNIVEVITAGLTGDDLRLPFFVMERLNGQSLRVVLEKKGQLELPHAYHIAIDLLDALDHAHDKNVIHRDVKPDNIFLHRTSAGVTVTKLLDFGIQSLLDSTQRETAGRFLGTLRYAAPEQLRGERPTPAVDVYAAALVLYEMIAGRGPFDDEGDPHAIGAAHMDKAPPPLSRFVPVPRELQRLMSAALAKDPRARPRDAFAFAASLRNFKKAAAGTASHDSTGERATAPALAGAAVTAPFVEVRQAPEGNYVVAPAVRGQPASSAPGRPVRTTFAGMSPPSADRTSRPAPAEGPTMASPAEVDRQAPTHSYVAPPDPRPSHGTEPFELVSAPQPSPSPPALPDDPLHWPQEAGVATNSEEPQVQMISVPAPRVARSGLRMAAAGVFLGLMAASLFVFSWRRFPSSPSPDLHAARGAPLVRGTAPITPPPASEPTVPPPRPVNATPSVAPSGEDRTEPGESAKTAAPSPPPSASATAKRRPAGSAPPKSSFSRADRPGPGF